MIYRGHLVCEWPLDSDLIIKAKCIISHVNESNRETKPNFDSTALGSGQSLHSFLLWPKNRALILSPL